MATPLKALLFLGGATAAALGAAYVAGVFDPAQQAPAGIAQPTTPPGKPATEVQAAAPPAAEKPAAEGKPAEQQVAAAAPEKPETKAPATGPIAPSFDLLRVEADGSTVIAGKAMPGSTLEAL
ncbi:peptigoglycan-binding protein LysM, partial [Salmonella enterica subsp. enterica]|nr:peptigoglycan-binding protein LysM [Salmonella enterica subsp. enterica]